MAYTYLLGWPTQDRWYYGVRFAKGASPDDLWLTYFTSSKHVKEFIKHFGNPTIIEIRNQFSDERVAKHAEEMTGRERSQEHSRHISESLIGLIPWNKGKRGVQVAWNKGLRNCQTKKSPISPP